ncbi:LamG-like jellyroll fold domain-containing protein [Tichowtungia aerotolerans]|uniref:Carbohydrate-binding domain-containing protein n=1 Tax=Tichowtungia aerotolerans TaxID=2697043 RepID=A0A6P1MCG1_9BACT|nr:LamG-like jellyroll fold domain-containing protein [Tichowtungia aerotolerans]QHI69286.1 hypothetical protein GT409_07430 [Tichowtungia aerotolerans]
MRKHQYRVIKSIVAVTLLFACGTAFAANWTGAGGDDDWMNPANWGGTLPTAQNTWMDNSDTAVLYADDEDTVAMFFPGGTPGIDLTIKGTLNATGRMRIAEGAGTTGIVTVDGGTLNVADHFYVGAGGTGKLIVTNGGTVNQTVSGYGFQVPPAWGTGTATNVVELIDGAINTVDLAMTAKGLIKIGADGSLVVDGNEKTEIEGYIGNGWIVPVSSFGTITVTYDGSNTIVQAVVPDLSHRVPYVDNENTVALWHMDAVRDQEFVDDDDRVVFGRNADLTVFPNPNTNGPALVDPAVTPGLDFPVGNAAFGNCLYLDNIQSAATNTAQYLNIPWGDTPVDRTKMRIEGWCKSDVAYDDQILVDRWGQIVVYARDDGFTVLRWDANYVASWKDAKPAGFAATNWNHFAVEATSSNLLIYVNGTLESDTELDGGLFDFTSREATTIGARYNTSSAFKGYIDEFRIYTTGPAVESLRAFDAPQAVVPPVIDGVLGNSEWGDSITLDLAYPDLTTLPNVGAVAGNSADMDPADISGSFSYKWDADYLYFGFEITDDVHIAGGYPDDHLLFGFNPSISNTVWDDTLTFEMFVDGSGTAQTSIYKDGGGTLKLDSSVFAGSTDGASWKFEAKLKWTEILNDAGYVPATNDQFGTILLLCDNDADDGARDVFLYSIAGGSVMTEPAGWHTVSLAGPIPTVVVTYNDWIADYSVGVQTNLSDDFDLDGMNHLVEYALGGNPEVDDAADILPVSYVDSSSNLFAYVYSRRLGSEGLGLTYYVQRDSDLVNTPDGWTTNGVAEVVSGLISASFEEVTATVPMDVDGRFLRLQIEASQ